MSLYMSMISTNFTKDNFHSGLSFTLQNLLVTFNSQKRDEHTTKSIEIFSNCHHSCIVKLEATKPEKGTKSPNDSWPKIVVRRPIQCWPSPDVEYFRRLRDATNDKTAQRWLNLVYSPRRINHTRIRRSTSTSGVFLIRILHSQQPKMSAVRGNPYFTPLSQAVTWNRGERRATA